MTVRDYNHRFVDDKHSKDRQIAIDLNVPAPVIVPLLSQART